MNNFNNIFLPYCIVWIWLSHIYFDIFLGEYLSSYANIHISLIRFGVLMNTKYQENGFSSINMSNYHNYFPPVLYSMDMVVPWSLWYFFWANIDQAKPFYFLVKTPLARKRSYQYITCLHTYSESTSVHKMLHLHAIAKTKNFL